MFPAISILCQVEWNVEACVINIHNTGIHRWFMQGSVGGGLNLKVS